MVHADIMVESPLWEGLADAEAVVRQALDGAAAALPGDGELAIVLTDDSAIRTLNRTWRGIDKPTNVLSFPAAAPPATADAPHLLGDIVIAHETTAREALEQ